MKEYFFITLFLIVSHGLGCTRYMKTDGRDRMEYVCNRQPPAAPGMHHRMALDSLISCVLLMVIPDERSTPTPTTDEPPQTTPAENNPDFFLITRRKRDTCSAAPPSGSVTVKISGDKFNTLNTENKTLVSAWFDLRDDIDVTVEIRSVRPAGNVHFDSLFRQRRDISSPLSIMAIEVDLEEQNENVNLQGYYFEETGEPTLVRLKRGAFTWRLPPQVKRKPISTPTITQNKKPQKPNQAEKQDKTKSVKKSSSNETLANVPMKKRDGANSTASSNSTLAASSTYEASHGKDDFKSNKESSKPTHGPTVANTGKNVTHTNAGTRTNSTQSIDSNNSGNPSSSSSFGGSNTTAENGESSHKKDTSNNDENNEEMLAADENEAAGDIKSRKTKKPRTKKTKTTKHPQGKNTSTNATQHNKQEKSSPESSSTSSKKTPNMQPKPFDWIGIIIKAAIGIVTLVLVIILYFCKCCYHTCRLLRRCTRRRHRNRPIKVDLEVNLRTGQHANVVESEV